MNIPDTVNYDDSCVSYNKFDPNEPQESFSQPINDQSLHTMHDKNTTRKSISKGETLFYTHKDMRSRREEIHKKAEIEKEIKALESCTFSPKINKFDKKESDERMHKESYSDYIDRMRKYRSDKVNWAKKCDAKAGSGKLWRKSLTGFTVPEDLTSPRLESKRTRRISEFTGYSTISNFKFTDSQVLNESPNKNNIKIKVNKILKF